MRADQAFGEAAVIREASIAAGQSKSPRGTLRRAFRNASIDAGEMTLWVMNRRAGHKLPRPVFPR